MAATGGRWAQLRAPPEGEVLWRDGGDQAHLTLDGWPVSLSGGKAGLHAARLRATLELAMAMRGGRARAKVGPSGP